MGRLVSVKLENFKSYPGTQTIGPFKDFTAVIGPNGAGKSNLMDAISFVLGVQSRQLRSNQMKELIFRADDLAPGKRRASVQLTYQLSAGELEGYEEGECLHFKRTISPTGVGSYRLNEKEVTGEGYENTLKQIGVLVKARNFLVFQGDVESIAQKAPKDLTLLFEQISGSEDLRESYEEARLAKDEADETTIFAYQKKKAQAAERKQVKEQKEEAERYNAKIQELADVTSESYLYQLYHVKTQLDTHNDKVESIRVEVREAEGEEAKLEGEMEGLKREQAALHKDMTRAEREAKKRRDKVEGLAPEVIKGTAALKSLHDRLHEDKTAGLKIKADWQENKEKKKGLKDDITKCEEGEASVQQEMEAAQEQHKHKGLALSGSKLEEYKELKQQVAAQTAQHKAKLMALQRQQQTDKSEEEVKRRELELHEGTLEQTTQEAKQQEAKSAALSADVSKRSEEKNLLEQDLHTLEQQQQQDEQRLTQVKAELKSLEEVARQHKHQLRQSKAEERMTRAIEELKDMYPGVKGRLLDLCHPSQRKWALAISVAGGRLMDAIVTDTKHTAAECIRYLREQRVGVAEFIPLNSIKTREVVERYRSLGKGYRLAIDVVECEEEIRPAVLYALGASTVICDSLELARDLCFKRNEQCKAVTETGGVIAKDGTMTGGRLDSEREGGRGGGGTMAKWDAKEQRDNKNKWESLEAELRELQRPLASRRQEVTDKATALSTLRAKIKSASESIKFAQKKASELKAQRVKALSEVERLREEQHAVTQRIEARARDIDKTQHAIDTTQDKVFKSFCKEMGLKSIRDYEDKEVALMKGFEERLEKLAQHKAKLQAQLEREERKDYDDLLKRAIEQVKKLKEQIKESEASLEAVKEKQASLKEAQHEAEAALEQAKAAHDDKHKQLKSLSKERGSLSAAKVEAGKRVAHEEATLERIRARAHEILQKARVEEVKLPVKRGSLSSNSNRGEEDEEEESMDVESHTNTQDTVTATATHSGSRNEVSTHPSQSQHPSMVRDRVTVERIDFSALPKKMRTAQAGKEEQEAIKKDYAHRMATLQAEVEHMQPNLRALERYEDVSRRVKESSEAYEHAKNSAQHANAKFAHLRQQRKECFMECFASVSEALTSIYRDLTKSSKHPLGGKAFLSLDDSEEPFLGGIKYHAMPPMKRFRDMDQLSGGEKTVAALALLFAIHSYRPAPFFVMDEVDAALDNVNVRKVCTYIKERSSEFQCVVISLKDMFFEHANALVGICRDRAANGSKTLTLDLDHYDTQEPEDEEGQ